MTQAQMVTNKRELYAQPITLPTNVLEGSISIALPWQANNIAVLNYSGATIQYASGRMAQAPADAVLVEPHVYLGLPLEETQSVTIFWSTPSYLSAGDNQLVILFSNLTIPVNGGAMTTGGVATNVTVANTPNVNVVSMPTNIGVNVNALPAIEGSDYDATPANHIIKVDANGIQYTTIVNSPSVTVANTTLAEAGIVGNAQTAVGATAVQLTVPTGTRNFAIENMDTTNILYLGSSNAVTASDGFPISPKQTFAFDCDPAATIVVWAIASAALTVATVGVK